MSRPHWKSTAALLALGMVAMVVAACGGSTGGSPTAAADSVVDLATESIAEVAPESPADVTTESTPEAPTESTDGSAADSAAPPPPEAGSAPDVLTILASEWSFTISGTPHAGLVELKVSNVGENTHEFGLVKVKDGVTLDQVKDALAVGEDAARALQDDPDAEITSAGIAGPHVNEHVVVPLQPGHYIVSSFLPGPGGKPQALMGMTGEFSVMEPASIPRVAPASAGTVELTDSGITLPDGFDHGGTFTVTNTGTTPHDFSLALLKDAPLPDYFGCIATSLGAGGSIDDCPGVLQGGVTTLQPGASAVVTVVFAPGTYGYVSSYGNGADFQAGLNGTFTVG